jgi:hypothetical protein
VFRIRIDSPDPDPGGAKITHKNRKIFEVLAVCSLMRAEGFSCSLDVLNGGIGISKLQFLKKISAVNFFSIFVHQNPGSGFVFMKPKISHLVNLKL